MTWYSFLGHLHLDVHPQCRLDVDPSVDHIPVQDEHSSTETTGSRRQWILG